MEPAERVAVMLRTAAQSMGRPLDEVETKWATALFVAVVVESEVSREVAETPS